MVGVFFNNSNFCISGIRLLVPYSNVGGGGGGCIFTPILSKWFISDLGKTILYFRNDFQNLAAEQKQNHAAPYHTTPVVLRNVAHSTKGKLPEIV